jgi:acetyl-CoA acyltransferase
MNEPRIWIAGVGMTAFVSPGRGQTYTELAQAAVREALEDAGMGIADIGQIVAGYVYGDSTSGQRAVYGVGMEGVPVINVNNNCASGSTALYLARQAILGGSVDCVLALGFEQMPRGALAESFQDRPRPLDPWLQVAAGRYEQAAAPLAPYLFGCAARDYAAQYGLRPDTLARISVKSRRHAAGNPRAIFRDALSIEDVLASPLIFDPLTRLQCCPPTSGAAAAILVSERLAGRLRNGRRRVSIAAQVMTTDQADSFSGDMQAAVGATMTRRAARQAYEQAGIGPEGIHVVELHDCFTINELISYEALGLAREGEAERMVHDGDNTHGGRIVVNPSGGLLAKGHPLGATGLAQCHELVMQLRGDAGARQVERARTGLQHNIGLGGACVVTIYAQS